MQKYSLIDQLLIHADRGLRTVFAEPDNASRPSPAKGVSQPPLAEEDKVLSARLMRVNHAGEIAAQALYHGQALTARQNRVRGNMEHAAREEGDHLLWCHKRIQQLEGRVSLLNPLWYGGAFCIGVAAGAVGDRWSLGFIAETEKQVVEHLDSHLQRLPADDHKSRAILEQMQRDEDGHAKEAMHNGGTPLPKLVSWLMRQSAQVMTRTAYWL